MGALMAVFRLPDTVVFPDPELAAPSGLLAVGGDLSPDRLVLAYAMGIFPWYSDGEPILWHAPPERMILRAGGLRVSRSLRRSLRRRPYKVSLDRKFSAVIDACRGAPRPGQEGTWITSEMRDAYIELHQRGLAHSVETWQDGELVGGLYGVSLGAAFFGESMFSRADDASKVALVHLVRQLEAWRFHLVDCQVHTPLLESLGGDIVPRSNFAELLREALRETTRQGLWRLEIAPPLR